MYVHAAFSEHFDHLVPMLCRKNNLFAFLKKFIESQEFYFFILNFLSNVIQGLLAFAYWQAETWVLPCPGCVFQSSCKCKNIQPSFQWAKHALRTPAGLTCEQVCGESLESKLLLLRSLDNENQWHRCGGGGSKSSDSPTPSFYHKDLNPLPKEVID